MKLDELAKKIEADLITADGIKGNISYTGKTPGTDGSQKLNFFYKFPQGEAREFVSYDHGDTEIDNDEQNRMTISKNILFYYLKKGPYEINFLKKSENEANIEICRNIKKIRPLAERNSYSGSYVARLAHDLKKKKTPLSKIPDNLTFYLECERRGLSPEESRDPYRYDIGRAEWLKQN